MESPHLYENSEFKKGANNMKNKSYSEVCDYDLDNLSNQEISMNLQNYINDSLPAMSEPHAQAQDLCQELAHLNMDKPLSYPRGIGANPGLNCMLPLSNEHPYNSLTYVQPPVHSTSQYDHQYQDDRLPIKEEPNEATRDALRDYPSCARMAYPAYNGYPLTPTVVPGADQGLLKSPHKSPTGLLKGSPKKSGNNDEYRRRRERNNIAVRKSREKAKLRSRETEEKVKSLTDENRHLHETCNTLQQQIALLRSVFSTLQIDLFPEPAQSELRTILETINFNSAHRPHM